MVWSKMQPVGKRRPLTRSLSMLLTLLILTLLAGCGEGSGDDSGTGDEGSSNTGQDRSASQSTVQTTQEPDGGTAGKETEKPEEIGASGANEVGSVMVLEYHRIGGDPNFAPEWTISTQQFRRELTYLYENDYYPVAFRDLVEGKMEVPAGKTPVVLTFDDSSDTQFTMVREEGELVPEPGGAVGVLADFHRKHQDWPMAGTFFVLPEANAPNNLFGQPELAEKKLRYLADAEFEIGTHTLYHANLAQATPAGVREQLALSVAEIQKHLPDYEVDSLSLPFGEYPLNESLLKSGTWQGQKYELEGAAEVSGGASPAPHDARFDPYHVPRIQTGELAGQSQALFRYFEQNPRERYVSDGDPEMITVPEVAADSLDAAKIEAAGKHLRTY